MGQYWIPVNIDKKEFIDPHKLAVGLKLGEQVGSGHGSPDALFILTAAMRERRGGGDFDWDSNYYGKERTAAHPLGAPVVEDYNEVAKRTIGRWAGDRIAVVGDYAEDTDLPGIVVDTPNGQVGASEFYGLCREDGSGFADITADVARVIEHEAGGTFTGDKGWLDWKPNA